MGFASNIVSGLSTAQNLETNAKLTEIQGTSAKNAAYRQANAVEDSAAAQAKVAGLQMSQARSDQSQAVGAARTQKASSGFDMTSGSGGAAETAVANAYEQQLENMALSSSISQSNALNQGATLRHSGDVAEYSASLQSELLNNQASVTRNSQWLTAIGGVAGGAAGGMMADEQGGSVLAGSLFGSSAGSSTANALNPYTSSFTSKDWEKNFLGMFYNNNSSNSFQ